MGSLISIKVWGPLLLFCSLHYGAEPVVISLGRTNFCFRVQKCYHVLINHPTGRDRGNAPRCIPVSKADRLRAGACLWQQCIESQILSLFSTRANINLDVISALDNMLCGDFTKLQIKYLFMKVTPRLPNALAFCSQVLYVYIIEGWSYVLQHNA